MLDGEGFSNGERHASASHDMALETQEAEAELVTQDCCRVGDPCHRNERDKIGVRADIDGGGTSRDEVCSSLAEDGALKTLAVATGAHDSDVVRDAGDVVRAARSGYLEGTAFGERRLGTAQDVALKVVFPMSVARDGRCLRQCSDRRGGDGTWVEHCVSTHGQRHPQKLHSVALPVPAASAIHVTNHGVLRRKTSDGDVARGGVVHHERRSLDKLRSIVVHSVAHPIVVVATTAVTPEGLVVEPIRHSSTITLVIHDDMHGPARQRSPRQIQALASAHPEIVARRPDAIHCVPWSDVPEAHSA
mmetsp:Transcript_14882/g.40778  ORF Transcript_14882/g.40778 Transcript_14882/m.40778 type:complete len:304 (-) Transcript_14882:1266-2177(-)